MVSLADEQDRQLLPQRLVPDQDLRDEDSYEGLSGAYIAVSINTDLVTL
jgi:hypothetical protein